MKKSILVCFTALFAQLCTAAPVSAEVELPGEASTNAPISCAPFPDRMSAYVWRNWFVVPHDRLARTVGAEVAELEKIAKLKLQ